jgi:ATPase subunit of ABC transporter with duplicated ATPase domains
VLQVRELAVEVGGVVTLDHASFTVRAGDKVGITGRNGAGKTSLLRVLAGDEAPFRGVVQITGGLGYLSQDPRMDQVDEQATALTHVISGRGFDQAAAKLEKLRLAVEERPSDERIERYSKAEERFRMDGGYAAESEAHRLADGLGLATGSLNLALGSLSGGQRRRVELARILFAGSEVLLLDEPTNHLDSDAKGWLLEYIRRYRGALLVISHDLDLLDDAITRVIHLERYGNDDTGTLTEYKGTYSQYLAGRERDEVQLTRQADREQSEIQRLSHLADSMRPSGPARRSPWIPGWPSWRRSRWKGRPSVASSTCASPSHRWRAAPCSKSRTWLVPMAMSTCSTRCRSLWSAASDSWSWGSTAPARPRCCASWPGWPRPTSARSATATRSTTGTTPRSTTCSTPPAR